MNVTFRISDVTVKKNEKIHMDSEKSLNSFEMKTRIGYLIIC